MTEVSEIQEENTENRHLKAKQSRIRILCQWDSSTILNSNSTKPTQYLVWPFVVNTRPVPTVTLLCSFIISWWGFFCFFFGERSRAFPRVASHYCLQLPLCFIQKYNASFMFLYSLYWKYINYNIMWILWNIISQHTFKTLWYCDCHFRAFYSFFFNSTQLIW